MLANIDALKNTKKMALLHCAGRTRSIIGACTLKAAGYDGPFAIFRGGTQAWQLDGHEREHGAQRLFAREVDDTKGVRDFLRKWEIPYEQVDGRDVTGFVSHHNSEHLFDVSDDAATGQRTGDGIMKISGTNLIQQTDRSIARYHVPVVLFDHGSGSRAAFAAFWLRAMGFSVRVAYLTGPLTDSAAEFQKTVSDNISHDILSAEQLVKFRDRPGSVLDFRPSQAYCQGHVKGSQWCNISDVLTRTNPAVPSSDPIVIIGNDIAHGDETARLLSQHGWHIAGIHGWDETAMDPAQVVRATLIHRLIKARFLPGVIMAICRIRGTILPGKRNCRTRLTSSFIPSGSGFSAAAPAHEHRCLRSVVTGARRKSGIWQPTALFRM